MPDIFDEIAGNVTMSSDAGAASGDIFDQIAGSVFESSPSLGDRLIGGIKSGPAALYESVKQIPSGLSSAFDAVFSPVDSLADGTTEAVARGAGTLASGIAGAGVGAQTGAGLGLLTGPAAPVASPLLALLGAAVGGGAGVLGFNKLNQATGSDAPTTAEEDLGSLAEMTGQGVSAGALSKLLGKVAGKVGEKAQTYADKAHQEALGANANSFTASARRDGVIRFQEVVNPDGSVTKVPLKTPTTSLAEAIKGVESEGLITPTTTAADLSVSIATKIDDLGLQVRSIINSVDDARSGEGIKIYPRLTAAQEFIDNEAPAVDRPALRKELAKWNEAIRNEGDGSLGFLQDQKIRLGRQTYGAGKETAEGFDKALTSDFRRTIEDVTNAALGEERAGAVAGLNKRLGNLMEVQKIPDIAAIREANKATTGFLHNLSASTGGAVGTGIAGGLALGPLGVPIGLGAGLTARYLQSPGGKVVQSRIASPLGRSLEAVADVVEGAGAEGLGAALAQSESNREAIEKSSELEALLKKILPANQAAPKSPDQKNQKSATSPLLKPISGENATPYGFINTLLKGEDMDMKPAQVIEEIKKNPTDHAIALMESNLDPDAKNPESSASGLFQLINKTAKNLGVKDVFDPAQNYQGYLKLKQDTIDRFGTDDYRTIYASHYLGAPTLKKWLDGDTLTEAQQKQVDYLEKVLFPRLDKFYQKALKESGDAGLVEA